MHAATGHRSGVADKDDAALRKARSGDVEAFGLVVTARLEPAFAFACAILGSEVEAATATQSALVAAWRELPRLDDLDHFDGWLHRILLNECRMRLRVPVPREARSRRQQGSDVEDAWDLQRDAALDLLERAFDGLDVEDRAVMVLHHLEDQPLADIAGALHMPPATVKWRLHESRELLRHALETGT